jgi:hypothetical protein
MDIGISEATKGKLTKSIDFELEFRVFPLKPSTLILNSLVPRLLFQNRKTRVL